MDQLDPDSVPFPFSRIVIERNPCFLERMRQHEGPEQGDIFGSGLRAAAFAPGE